MPKVVDHAVRRRELVGAALRVITTEGFAAVSVRRVAEESGHSAGALRHYFPRQQALLDAVIDQVTTTAATRLVPRIRALEVAGPADVLDAACALLAELMPLDDQRATEWALWSALSDRSPASAEVRQWRTAGWVGTRHHCRHVLQRLREPAASGSAAQPHRVPSTKQILEQTRSLRPLPDPVDEARAAALHAALDGLSAQTRSFPEELPPHRAAAVLRRAVTDLATQVRSPGDR